MPGAFSAALGDQTALLTFNNSERHPSLGNGLFFKLQLPTTIDTSELPGLANRLNVAELEAIDAPPSFGAWCADTRTSSLVFVGFWPNVLRCLRGTVANISAWMLHRTRHAQILLAREVMAVH